MTESTRKFQWQSTIPIILGISTILIGIWQYSDKQAQANREPFLKAQMKLLFEASEVVATLASTRDPIVWRNTADRFWILYWGPLSVVENRKVEILMVRAKNIIRTSKTEQLNLPVKKLQQTSLDLAHSIRNLIHESWNISLGPLGKP